MSRTNRAYDLSLDPARGRRRSGFAAAVGLCIVLFNILAAALPGAVHRAEASAAPGLENIVVCTSFGMVTRERDGKPLDPAPCPFCLPMMQGRLDVPAAGVAPVVAFATALAPLRPCWRVPPAPTRVIRAAPARAPPA